VRIKRNDTVLVIAGKDKGKTGRVLKVDHERNRLLVEGVNIIKKTARKKKQNDRGGIIEVEGSIHASNVMIVNRQGNPSRIGYRFENGRKVRFAKNGGEVL
jgi:large subunit ribosomal protein L24